MNGSTGPMDSRPGQKKNRGHRDHHPHAGASIHHRADPAMHRAPNQCLHGRCQGRHHQARADTTGKYAQPQ
ncbi:hypothetical protein Q672_04300 [Marinobacter sp. EVN1]|uniref:hypothetical protein n=1 Tax=Marinobacter sp. EVN1 TaxID=1397532 RepID=UPI0003B7FBBB|nr:hypothetical protein [Marinobacter sp. EVN1]ERS83677.1 hypothetical protein Q672_04300 [Marinobacter sp. EVN1]